ncbi:MAG: hypothetical protein GEV06_15310 [Luteitalea sp.]|nr:hypothetical protein [Luteitalea sp.]
MSWYVGEIFRRDALLAWVGVINLALALVMVLLLPFDTRLVAGINPWIKPLKFALSIALYAFTVAWYMGEAQKGGALRSTVRWGIALAMMTEIACIGMQAARGTTSHFNNATAFDAGVFQLMGAMISLNTVLGIGLLWLLRGPTAAPRVAYLWGLRFGLVLFLLATVEGFAMVAASAHTVALPDGGPGLPFLNWSTRAGDLRVAHFLGLHSLQIFPIAGYLLDQLRPYWSSGGRVTAMGACAAVWLALMVGLFLQAMAGRPFLAL